MIGARGEGVESLTGFDEGPLPADWTGELQRYGIIVQQDLSRDKARDVPADYTRRDGKRY